jgi:hypothetical protein
LQQISISRCVSPIGAQGKAGIRDPLLILQFGNIQETGEKAQISRIRLVLCAMLQQHLNESFVIHSSGPE